MKPVEEIATAAPAGPGAFKGASGALYFKMFVYLQLLDALTTLLGFRLGAQEASPIVRLLTDVHPLAGLAISKAAAFLLVALCYWTGRSRVVARINYWFAALVVWNVCVLLLVA
ncbi:MAG: DUF5658 family protein [Bryobacterales bacterium]|nr:DUF5658 family protein [Bryobacteraceae bacterium]MDW8131014.1 DUF5658 family protein [Bryobacterales bacterium]